MSCGEDGQFTLRHIAHFTIQYWELSNYEKFSNYKLRLFPNTLTGASFTWYATLQGIQSFLGKKWGANSTPNFLS